MNNLLAAIMTKLSGSALETAVGGRVYLDEAPEGAAFPNVIFRVISSVLDKTFTEEFRFTVVEFSLYSISDGAAEITGLYENLKALFDECVLTITGFTCIWMRELSLATMRDEATTLAGTVGCTRWAAEYEIRTSLN